MFVIVILRVYDNEMRLPRTFENLQIPRFFIIHQFYPLKTRCNQLDVHNQLTKKVG